MTNPYQIPMAEFLQESNPSFEHNRHKDFVLPDQFRHAILQVTKVLTKRNSMEEDGVDEEVVGTVLARNLQWKKKEGYFNHHIVTFDPLEPCPEMLQYSCMSSDRITLDCFWYMRQVDQDVIRGNHCNEWPWSDYIFTIHKQQSRLRKALRSVFH